MYDLNLWVLIQNLYNWIIQVFETFIWLMTFEINLGFWQFKVYEMLTTMFGTLLVAMLIKKLIT